MYIYISKIKYAIDRARQFNTKIFHSIKGQFWAKRLLVCILLESLDTGPALSGIVHLVVIHA
jgi:hypothetical protein